jgi:phenylalanyl-tRNA synthetase beta subunit
VVHPEVLEKFEITNPVCALELNLEPFCFGQDGRPLPTHLAARGHAAPAARSAAST